MCLVNPDRVALFIQPSSGIWLPQPSRESMPCRRFCSPYWRKEVICVASEGEIRAAIAKSKNDPKNATKRDWELVEKAAQQQGSLGNEAKQALGRKPTGLFG